jgi:hypothetical protein
MHRVECFGLLAGDTNALLGDDTKARLLDHSIDSTGQITSGGIRFDDRKRTLDRHRVSFPSGIVRGSALFEVRRL